jgi:hypothetical protein
MLDPRKFDDFKKFFAEYGVIVRGELDAEYKRVAGLIAEWDQRNNLKDTLQQISVDKADHENAKIAFQRWKDGAEEKLKQWEDELTAKAEHLTSSETSISNREGKLRSEQAQHDANVRSLAESNSKRSAELDEQQKALNNKSDGLHLRELNVAAREDKVQKVMSQLNVDWKG